MEINGFLPFAWARKIKIACLFFILSFLLISSFQVLFARRDSKVAELENIQSLIKKKGLKWNAELTDIAMRSDAEKKKLLGGAMPELGPNVKQVIVQTTSGLPSSFDWRNKNGKDWMTPVKEQSSCGSCWAFAAVGAAEAKFNIYNNDPNLDLDLSEQQLVSCSTAGDCNGGSPRVALDNIKNTGLVDEYCFPYTASNSACVLCSDSGSRTHKIKDYFWVEPNTTNTYKTALINYGPLVVELNAGEDLFYYAGGIYEPTGIFGGVTHAVVLVGYNDVGGYWIVKNSWGTSWGENGYYKVSYGNIEKYDYALAVKETDIIRKDTTPPVITMSSPQSKTYSTSSVPLTFTVNEPTSWIGYSLDNQPNVTITGSTTLTGLTNGGHNVIVYAKDLSGNGGSSSKVYFTVSVPCTCTPWVKTDCDDVINCQYGNCWLCTSCYYSRTCTPRACLTETRRTKACTMV